MPISEFKARCLSVLERVRRTGRPLRVTRYGRPVADVVPVGPAVVEGRTLGSLKDDTTILGDLIAPVVDSDAWAALKPR